MTALAFAVVDARVEPHAAVPTIVLRLSVTEEQGGTVHALVLGCQIRIDPQRRRYRCDEEDRLYGLFGETTQWGQSMRPFLWTHASVTVPGFSGSTVCDLPIVCTYDFEVAGVAYLHALAEGEIPLVLLFSGTAFTRGERGLTAEPVSWNEEATYRLPVSTWRQAMDSAFPNSAWVRIHRDTLERLCHFQVAKALATWDQVFERLLMEAGEVSR
jgi:hypothetical protein